MENKDQFVSRAEFARLRGWDRSYVTQLDKAGRLVFSPDGELVDVLASDKRISETADPSKDGVKRRWEDQRIQKTVYDDFDELEESRSERPEPSAFHQARASREHYAGELARLEFEWVSGLLVSRIRVEDAAHTMGRQIRDRFMGMPARIAPELAAVIDPWEVEQRLEEAIRTVLEDVVKYGDRILQDAINDPSKGKLSDLSRVGKERYGQGDNSTTS